MTKSRTAESLVSALVILLIALVLLLTRATAHGESADSPTAISTATEELDESAKQGPARLHHRPPL